MNYTDCYDPKKTCRICLREKSEMISMFRKDDKYQIDDLILYCSNVHVTFKDSTSNSICPDCLKELDVSVKFKKKCEHSEKALKRHFKTEFNDVSVKVEVDVVDLHQFEPSSSNNSNTRQSNSANDRCNITDGDELSEKLINVLICSKNKTNENVSRSTETFNDDNNHLKESKIDSSKRSQESVNELLSKDIIKSHKSKSRKSKYLEKVNNFKCETCNLQCQNKWVLKVHMRTHSGERPFQCDLCKKRFVSNSNMRMHKRLTHNDDKQVCSECGKSFSCLTYLKRHLIIHYKVKPYGCTICQKRFTTKSYLKEHIARHKGDKRFFCEICASKFISDVNLKQHMLVHGIQNRNFKRHQCTFCDYKTMGKVDLARHIRKHTGEKPFRCPEEGCQSAFAGKASLKLHIRIHTGEKPYTCSECPAKFSRGDKHKNHMIKKHNITNIGPNKRSKLIVKELAEAVENGQTTAIPMDILKVSS